MQSNRNAFEIELLIEPHVQVRAMEAMALAESPQETLFSSFSPLYSFISSLPLLSPHSTTPSCILLTQITYSNSYPLYVLFIFMSSQILIKITSTPGSLLLWSKWIKPIKLILLWHHMHWFASHIRLNWFITKGTFCDLKMFSQVFYLLSCLLLRGSTMGGILPQNISSPQFASPPPPRYAK